MRRLGQVNHKALHLAHALNRVFDPLRPNPRVLEPREREVVRPSGRRAIDLHRACGQLIRHEDGTVDVLREDTSLQAHAGLVGQGNGFRRVGDTDEGEDGAERLLPVDLHVLLHVVNDQGMDEVAHAGVRARQHRALLLGVLHEALDVIGRLPVDNSRDIHIVLRVPHRELCQLHKHLLQQGISNLSSGKHNFHRRAPLPRVGETTLDNRRRSQLEVSIGEDDTRVLPAQLHLQGDHACLLGDVNPSGPTSKGDEVSSRVLHEVVTDLRALARHDIDEPGRGTSDFEGSAEVEGGDGALGGGLDDHGIAGNEGRADLGAAEVDGVVEGRDAKDDAYGDTFDDGELVSFLPDPSIRRQDLPGDTHALLSGVIEQLGGADDFVVGGLAVLAHLAENGGGDQGSVLTEDRGGFMEELSTLPEGGLGPHALGGVGSGVGLIDLLAGAGLDFVADGLVVGGEVLDGAARGGHAPFAVYQEFVDDAVVHFLEGVGLGVDAHGVGDLGFDGVGQGLVGEAGLDGFLDLEQELGLVLGGDGGHGAAAGGEEGGGRRGRFGSAGAVVGSVGEGREG